MEGGTVEMDELRRVVAIAQEAAARALPTRARDERNEPTQRVHRTGVDGAPSRRPSDASRASSALSDDERAAVSGHKRIVAGAAVGGASILVVVAALVAWLG